jgi:replication-associated recombination protein RarA
MAYEIGYRRPPASGRFKPGKSGNPQGRPKGSRNFLTLLEQELNKTISVTENGRKRKLTRLQAIVKRMVNSALAGDQRALLNLLEIMKRTGRFDAPAAEALLPDNYEELLEAFIQQRQRRPARSESPERGEE